MPSVAKILSRLVGACLFACVATASHAADIGEDGLHKQPWFANTFKDVAEDMTEAKEQGKRLVILFEQRGCIYCKKLHETVLSDPAIADYIAKNFVVVQYNLFGDEEVTDLDGKALSEKAAARKWRVVYTPTFMFMPETVSGVGGDAGAVAVSTMPGAFGKGTTRNMFQWVREKRYEGEEHFQKYHARKLAEKQGKAD